MRAWRRGIDGTGNPLGFHGRRSLSIKKSNLDLKNASPDSLGFVGIQSKYVVYIVLIHF